MPPGSSMMILNIVVAVVAAMGAAGLVFLMFKLMGRKPPKGVVPIFAALAILGITAAAQYGWEKRMTAGIPGMVVIDRIATVSPMMPWSYVEPVVDHLAVLDVPGLKHNPAHPNLVIGELLFLHRQADTERTTVVVDCILRRHLQLPPDADLDKALADGKWVTAAGPVLYDAACQG